MNSWKMLTASHFINAKPPLASSGQSNDMIFLVGLSNLLDFAWLCTTKAVKYRNWSMAFLTRFNDYVTGTAVWGKDIYILEGVYT